MHSTLRAQRFAQIRDATIQFGDLTVLVGPQATGKSILLQLLKLAVDAGRIAGALKENGFGWASREEFCAVYFGEGMSAAWKTGAVRTGPARTRHAPAASRTFFMANLSRWRIRRHPNRGSPGMPLATCPATARRLRGASSGSSRARGHRRGSAPGSRKASGSAGRSG